MKVLKFGGTSVGSAESILSLKRIVEQQEQQVIVVVSALGGITDKLIATSKLAIQGDEQYKEEFVKMISRHHEMIDSIIANDTRRKQLKASIDELAEELRSIYYGLFLIKDLSSKTLAAIVKTSLVSKILNDTRTLYHRMSSTV